MFAIQIHIKPTLTAFVFVFQGEVSFAAVNTGSSSEFSIDFDVEDVSDANDQAGTSSVAPGPSHSQATSARIA